MIPSISGEQIERDKESSAYSQIYNKIVSDQELTAQKKMLFVRKTLKAYMEYKAARMEQEAYERRLRDVRQKKRLKGFK